MCLLHEWMHRWINEPNVCVCTCMCVYEDVCVQVGKAGTGRGRKRKSEEQASSKELQLAGLLHIMFLLANDEVMPWPTSMAPSTSTVLCNSPVLYACCCCNTSKG